MKLVTVSLSPGPHSSSPGTFADHSPSATSNLIVPPIIPQRCPARSSALCIPLVFAAIVPSPRLILAPAPRNTVISYRHQIALVCPYYARHLAAVRPHQWRTQVVDWDVILQRALLEAETLALEIQFRELQAAGVDVAGGDNGWDAGLFGMITLVCGVDDGTVVAAADSKKLWVGVGRGADGDLDIEVGYGHSWVAEAVDGA